jgi:hypothetical protein
MSVDRIAKLKALRLFGMAAAWVEWLAEPNGRPAA